VNLAGKSAGRMKIWIVTHPEKAFYNDTMIHHFSRPLD